jgi:CheY-like chemotaxis protein
MTKILVVDDEPLIVALLAEIAAEYNHVIFTALNGKQAFEICLKENPELVITDIMMPGMNGYELCQSIKNHPRLKGTHVVMMTAGSFNPSLVEGQYHSFIKKPFNLDEIDHVFKVIYPIQNTLPQFTQILPNLS